MKMDDVALVACNQCMNDNGKKPETDDYEVRNAFKCIVHWQFIFVNIRQSILNKHGIE